MNADTGMAYQSSSNRPTGGTHWRGCAGGEPWKLVEILAMVLGFIVFWPLGLAVTYLPVFRMICRIAAACFLNN